MSHPRPEPVVVGTLDALADWQRFRREFATYTRAGFAVAEHPPFVRRLTRDAVGEARLALRIHHERILGRAYVRDEAARIRRELGIRDRR